jgi:2,4-didehydro-3-deoxy-L-rhamnonate hydrolase
MSRTVRWSGRIALLLSILLAILAGLTYAVSRPLFSEVLPEAGLAHVRIAAPDQALSLARYSDGAQTCVLLVTAIADSEVQAVDTCRHFGAAQPDPLALYAARGYEALADAARDSSHRVRLPLAALLLPYDAPTAHIAIGTNYTEHARESGVAEQPFVFPKRVAPTAANAAVPRGDARRLDYEAELGLVALDDITPQSANPALGLVLVNDFTDRWSLVLGFDGDLEMGQTGFVDGKSRAGYAPIGNLLLIPRDVDTFYREVELSLYVNGRLRQRERAGRMLWGPAQMIAETFRRQDWTFHGHGGSVPLLPRAGVIERGTLIMSGTPAGVIFKPLNLWNPWLYLQPGDVVVTTGDGLGSLRNPITP